MDRTRRYVLTGAAAVAAAAAVPLPVAKGVDLGLGEYGPEKYFICWWDKVQLDAFAHAWRPLTEGRCTSGCDQYAFTQHRS
jgi:hypothetical protein